MDDTRHSQRSGRGWARIAAIRSRLVWELSGPDQGVAVSPEYASLLGMVRDLLAEIDRLRYERAAFRELTKDAAPDDG